MDETRTIFQEKPLRHLPGGGFFLEEIAVKPENQVISGLKGEEGSWIFVRIRTFKKWN
jgi:hypothetical protein